MLTQEQKNILWKTADKLRNNMDASEYKHVVLGLIFLKYISDRFQKRYDELKADDDDIEDRDAYLEKNIFFVPQKARWITILKETKSSEIGQVVDRAMHDIEKENKNLKNVLFKSYSKPELNKTLLGELIEEIDNIKTDNGNDFLGDVYEYFLGEFALAEGKKGGEFYTPTCIVELLVAILEPYEGRVFDPCCGSGGMFTHSEQFVKEHGGKIEDIAIYGQESNPTTLKLCKMNLAIRGISFDLGDSAVSSFTNDLRPDFKADFILANPPFNVSDWGGDRLKEDARWQYGIPPEGNANYAWIQHFIFHLGYKGRAGFVLSNGSMSSNTSSEGAIRKRIVQADLVEGIIALPDKLFSNTGIPACLWFLNNKDKKQKKKILFIDLRDEDEFGEMLSRRQRVLTKEDIKRVSKAFHDWQKDKNYQDVKGYCKSATLAEIEKNDFILTPGRYVGIKEVEEDDELFEDKMKRLSEELQEDFKKSKALEKEIKNSIKDFGFDI